MCSEKFFIFHPTCIQKMFAQIRPIENLYQCFSIKLLFNYVIVINRAFQRDTCFFFSPTKNK